MTNAVNLKPVRLKVNNILSAYNKPQTEQLAIVKSWLDRKGLQFIVSLTSAEKVTYSTLESLFEILTSKFRPQFNETIKSLQFHKLSRQNWENAEELIGRLKLLPIECNYKELDRQLKG